MNSFQFQEEMDEDMEVCNYSNSDKDETESMESVDSDIEGQLENLNTFDNEKQLDLLKKEICHIMVHGMTPSEGWFDERYKVIMEYSKLDWIDLAKRFKNRDEFIHNTSHYIFRILEELVEERGTKPNFTIHTYYQLILNMYSIWHYYRKVYIGNEEDTDIMDLIEGIKFL